MGLLWLSTVPLTSGLVATMFGTNHMGSLYGFVFLSHQIGAFFGVLLGGKIYTATGSYDTVWILAILLAVLSALLHLPIKEKPMPVFLSERKGSLS
jgi:MFS family permease